MTSGPVFDEGYAIDNATQQSATTIDVGVPGSIDVHLSTYLRDTLPADTGIAEVEAYVRGLLERAAAAVPELRFGYHVEYETEPEDEDGE